MSYARDDFEDDDYIEHLDPDNPEPKPITVGDNFRRLPRSDVMSFIGLVETIAQLPPRPDTDFTSHADHQNYLHGRNQNA